MEIKDLMSQPRLRVEGGWAGVWEVEGLCQEQTPLTLPKSVNYPKYCSQSVIGNKGGFVIHFIL